MNPIIFSADDFGKSDTANRNILNLAKLGKIDRVSVMINGNFSKEEVSELLGSKIKLDIHLELSKNKEEYNGIFIRSFLFLGKLFVRKNNVKQVSENWEKQVKKFLKIFDKAPDGLNSHEHVHFFPPYFKIALKLCQKYKISYLRFGSKGTITDGNKIGWILKILNLISNNKSRVADIDSSDYLTSLDWIKNYSVFSRQLPGGSTELVCHPEREKEYKLLKTIS